MPPLLLRTKSALLLQHLFLLLLNLCVDLGTLGRLVAVVLGLNENADISLSWLSPEMNARGMQRATYGESRILLGLSSLLGNFLRFALTLWNGQPCPELKALSKSPFPLVLACWQSISHPLQPTIRIHVSHCLIVGTHSSHLPCGCWVVLHEICRRRWSRNLSRCAGRQLRRHQDRRRLMFHS